MKKYVIVRYNWFIEGGKDDYCSCETRMEAIKVMAELYRDRRYEGCMFDIEER